jgi:signal transduction histidine kinase
MNLINNALIHAFDGRDSGQVLIRAETAEPGWIVLSVADDGCGISAEHRKRIFDPFFTTRLGQGGSGSACTSCSAWWSICSAGGSMSTTPGQGARFIVRLPQVAPQPNGELAVSTASEQNREM